MKMVALSLAAALIGSVGCAQQTSEHPVRQAELGVYYGGQIQQLRQVPWPTEGARPTLGFRLTFAEPLSEELQVKWEVDMPTRGGASSRVQRIQETRAGKGQERLDQSIEIPANAELGTWNVRVIAAERLVIDRAVRLFDPGR